MANRIQLRRDTAANWEDADPTLAAGEVGVDLTNRKIKIGDGSTKWTDLDYWDDQEPNPFDGSYNSLTGKPTLFSGSYSDLTNKPSLFSGSYNDLTNKPTIPDLGNVGQHVLPSTDNTYDLGSPTKQWRDIFVSEGSIYIGDVKLSNDSGTLLVQRVTDAGLVTEEPVEAPGVVTTDRLVNGINTVLLQK